MAAYRNSLKSIAGSGGLENADGPVEFVVTTFGPGLVVKGIRGAAALMAMRSAGQQAAGGLRVVGKYLESAFDAIRNPNLLKGLSPAQVEALIAKTPGWVIETLGKGRHKGQG
jgi:hypothetical protein